jgi:L-malate glycosyltransferase
MRVLQVDTEPGFRGGQRQLMLLCQGLRDRGVELTLAVRRGGALAGEALRQGWDVAEIPQASPVDPRAVTALSALIRDHRPDVVHAQASHALGIAAAVVRLRGGPPLVASRRVDFDIGRAPLNRFKYGEVVARFIAISEAVARVLAEGGVERERVRVIHSAVAPLRTPRRARDELRAEFDIGPSDLLALTTAALVDHKDHDTAVRAMALARPGVHLAIAGEGELRAAIERRIQDSAVADRVTLLGQRDDVPELLAAADLYVASSHLEGLCTALMDAGQAGLAVAGTHAGGIPEVVDDGRTGILVAPRDARGLAAAIDRLASDEPLRRRLGRAAEARIAERFGVDRMVEHTLATYREVTSP